MKYKVEVSRAALRDLKGLQANVRGKLIGKIDALQDQARPLGCQKLAGADDLWRVRWADYRIVYHIQDKVLHILVVKVAHRREVYRGL